VNIGLVLLIIVVGLYSQFGRGSPAASSASSSSSSSRRDDAREAPASPGKSSSGARAAKAAQEEDSRPQQVPTPLSQKAAEAAKEIVKHSTERYFGVVKRYSERNGIGFIDCETARQAFGKDVRVFREEWEGQALQVGDNVAFHAVLEGRPGCPKGQPWAAGVEKVGADGAGAGASSSAAAEEPENGGAEDTMAPNGQGDGIHSRGGFEAGED